MWLIDFSEAHGQSSGQPLWFISELMQSSSDNGLSLERPQFEATGLVQGNKEIEVQHP